MRNQNLFVLTLGLLLICCSCSTPTPTADRYATEIKQYVSIGDVSKAQKALANALKDFPRDGQFYLMAARIEEAQDNLPKAIGLYAGAAQRGTDRVASQLHIVRLLCEIGRARDALAFVTQLRGSMPNDVETLAWRALSEAELGQFDKSRQDAQTVLATDPQNAIANAVLAKQAIDQRDLDTALNLIDRGLKVDKPDPILLRLKAIVFARSNRIEDAIAAERALLAMRPNSPAILSSLAEQVATTKSVKEGEQILRSAVERNPENENVSLALTEFIKRHFDDDTTANALRDLVKSQPNIGLYDIVLARFLHDRNQGEAADKVLEIAAGRVADSPMRTAILAERARLKTSSGDISGALLLLDNVLSRTPDNEDALLLRSQIFIEVGRETEAISDLLQVSTRHPGSTGALQLLSEGYSLKGKNDEAIDALDRWSALDPSSLLPVMRQIEVYLHENDAQAAKRAIAAFITRNPGSIDAKAFEIKLAIRLGDDELVDRGLAELRQRADTSGLALLLEANLKEARQDSQAAAELYKRALDPTTGTSLFKDAMDGFARSVIKKGDKDDALTFLKSWDRARTNDDKAHNSSAQATILRSMNQHDEAEAACREALQLAPNDASIYIAQGVDLNATLNPAEAIRVLKTGLRSVTSKSEVLAAQASIEAEAGDVSHAIQDYRLALREDPTLVFAWNNLGVLLSASVEANVKELAQVRHALSAHAWTGNKSILDTLAWINHRLGDDEIALLLLNRSKAESSIDPNIRKHLGAIRTALGRKAKADNTHDDMIGRRIPPAGEAERAIR